jgi:hypothetical protein
MGYPGELMAQPFRIIIRSATPERLREILLHEDLDLNCGGPRKTATGEWEVEAYAAQTVATRLRKTGVSVEVDREFGKRLSARRKEVGGGDRFKESRRPPRGVGRKE